MLKIRSGQVLDSEISFGINFSGNLEVVLRIRAFYLHHSSIIKMFERNGWEWENSATYYKGEYDKFYPGNLFFVKEF